jgi:hypothetical protein
MWGALSDERTGLLFTVAASPRQRSHSRVQVPWDSWPHFTVSGSRLPFPSPPTTCRATMEVCDPSSTRDTPSFYDWTTYIVSRRSHRKHICCPAMAMCEPYRKHLFHYWIYIPKVCYCTKFQGSTLRLRGFSVAPTQNIRQDGDIDGKTLKRKSHWCVGFSAMLPIPKFREGL